MDLINTIKLNFTRCEWRRLTLRRVSIHSRQKLIKAGSDILLKSVTEFEISKIEIITAKFTSHIL
jgi:hypothetical protein